jgi:hypothetical protein
LLNATLWRWLNFITEVVFMSIKPVVVYGASGYTGRLVCEFLREYQIPFIAAGRNKARIEEVMAKVPGIETADYEVLEVSHDEASLTELFRGRKVVCNTVGPFAYYGETVIKAALAAGIHYLDTTGEQQYMREMRAAYGAQYAAKNLVLAPSVAYMFTPLEIAAQIVLETEGIDTLEAGVVATGVPTEGSTQSIFTMFNSEHKFLENNQLVEWERGRGWEISVPGKLQTQLAHPWGGGSLPIWFENDYRVRSCKQLTAFTNRPMFEYLIEMQKDFEQNLKHLPLGEQQAKLSHIAEQMTPGMPPRENYLIHRTTDFVIGRGTAVEKTCVLRCFPPYILTGVVQAATAHKLVFGQPDQVGFVSGCQAVGHKYLLGALKNFGPIEVDVF